MKIISQYCRYLRSRIITNYLLCFGKKMQRKKHYVSLCAIFKNEAKYLKEWIDYHLVVGVDHFYLYNNDSNDHYKKVLDPYVKKGIVTLIEFPGTALQMASYDHCVKNYAFESNWIGFIDLDEFICPIKQNSIPEWLSKFEKLPSVYVFWKMFSSGGRMLEDYDLVTEAFTLAQGCIVAKSKLFLNTDWSSKIGRFDTPHRCRFKGLGFVVPQNANLFFGLKKALADNEVDVQMNHYYCKSYQYFKEKKMSVGDAFFVGAFNVFDYFYAQEEKCFVPDYKIFKYMIKLKLKSKE